MSSPSNQQLLINARAFQTRVALLEQPGGDAAQQLRLAELHLVEPANESSVGNLICGRVQKVLPGMQAAFVEVGLARPGFLHASDIERPRVAGEATDIRRLVHEGQLLQVQIAKDPIASKGARLTTQVTLASRFLVLTPNSDHIGISQRLDCEVERQRLQQLVERCVAEVGMPAKHGFIVRTVAEGVGAEEVLADIRYLWALWQKIQTDVACATVGQVLHTELPVQVRVLRDLVTPTIAGIQIDDEGVFQSACAYLRQHSPEYVDRVRLHSGAKSLFDSYGLEPQIAAARGSRVPLPCGGYLVIEQTEAMVTVDVNTGGYTGSRSLEDTVFHANLEAANALPAQLRLRNLGGLVAVDFIDMEDDAHRTEVVAVLEAACAMDPTPTKVLGISDFGIVELSRKRTRESLFAQLSESCVHCAGTGRTIKASNVCFDILRRIESLGSADLQADKAEFLLQANEAVVHRLLSVDVQQLDAVVERAGVAVQVQSEAGFAVHQFDLVRLAKGHSSVQ